MKINFKLLSFLFAIMIIFFACEEDERFYGDFDPATSTATSKVIISIPSMDIVVDPNTDETTFTLSVQLQGALLSQDVTVPFIVDSTNLVEAQYSLGATGFVIPAGSNTGTLTVTLYKDEFFPGDLFDLYYSLGTPSAGEINELGKIGSFSCFNPGLLAPWVGTYTAAAASLTKSSWDEEWACTTVLDPTDPLHKILINTGGGGAIPAEIDPVAGTIVIAGNGTVLTGDMYGYGPNAIYLMDYAGTYGTSGGSYNIYTGDLTGTVDEDGTIVIPGFGLKMTGAYSSYIWDAFDVTFNKDDSKKSEGATFVPKDKKPQIQ